APPGGATVRRKEVTANPPTHPRGAAHAVSAHRIPAVTQLRRILYQCTPVIRPALTPPLRARLTSRVTLPRFHSRARKGGVIVLSFMFPVRVVPQVLSVVVRVGHRCTSGQPRPQSCFRSRLHRVLHARPGSDPLFYSDRHARSGHTELPKAGHLA